MAAIRDHGAIGDGHSVALVARDGTLDWLCWPRFDSPAVFASLLDEQGRGGHWFVGPTSAGEVERSYLEGTNVLVTRHHTPDGVLVVTDFMSAASEEEHARLLLPEYEVCRVVACEEGQLEADVRWAPRPDFGRAEVRIRDRGPLGFRVQHRNRLFTLRSTAPLELVDDGRAVAGRVRVRPGAPVYLSMSHDADAPAVLPRLSPHVRDSLERTARWWRGWSGRGQYEGPFREAADRSVLALKLMVYAPSGAVVAAATTSLPEKPGGSLNWDYRFSWVRDASFTVRALLELGHVAEAGAFVSWLLHTTRLTRPELRTLYDVYGRNPSEETEVQGLTGYGGASPVRVGNAASSQKQLDSYGEVIDAAARFARHSGELDPDAAKMLRGLGRYITEHWTEPDQGIWEPRGDPEHHVHSKMMCWTGLDRLLDLHDRGLLPKAPVERWERVRSEIRRDVEEKGWSEELQSYTAVYGGDSLDASLLLMGWYGFHPADHPRMEKTWQRIRERLGVGDHLLYRYDRSPEVGEGAFGICGAWAAEHVLQSGGDVEEGRAWIESMLRHASDVGLLSEEVDPDGGAALGNFPQAFSHVGLVNAIMTLHQRETQGRGDGRAKTSVQPPAGDRKEART